MNMTRLYALTGLLLIVAGVSGCTEGGGLAFRHDDTSDFPELIAEAAAIEQSSIDGVLSDQAPTTLVSAAVARKPVQPSLITLPRGGNLNAQIKNAAGPVLLDFFADWCGPCRTQGQILHDIEGTAAETQTLIIKINVDEHPELAKKLQVESLPTLMMVKNGKVVARQSGVANRNRLVAWMK